MQHPIRKATLRVIRAAIALPVLLLACAARADIPIGIERPELPDRVECRANFESIWDREFSKGLRKFQVYQDAWADLKKEKAKLEAARTDADWWKAASDWAIGVKLIAGITNSALGEAPQAQQIPEPIMQGVRIASATVDWVVERLRQGDYSVANMINSFATDEFHNHLLVSLAADQHALTSAAKTMKDFADDHEQQESDYAEYRRTLRQLIDDTDRRIEATRQSIAREQDRLFDLYHRAFELFCRNSPPSAKNDRGSVKHGETLRVHVLENDSDPEKRRLRISKAKVASGGGRLTVGDNHTPGKGFDDYILFEPEEGFSGQAVIEYEVTDDLRDSATAKLYIDVAGDPNKNMHDDLLADALEILGAQKMVAAVHDERVSEAELGRKRRLHEYEREQNRRAVGILASNGAGGGATSSDSSSCGEAGQVLSHLANKETSGGTNGSICSTYRALAAESQQALQSAAVRNCPEIRQQLKSLLSQAQNGARQVCAN